MAKRQFIVLTINMLIIVTMKNKNGYHENLSFCLWFELMLARQPEDLCTK